MDLPPTPSLTRFAEHPRPFRWGVIALVGGVVFTARTSSPEQGVPVDLRAFVGAAVILVGLAFLLAGLLPRSAQWRGYCIRSSAPALVPLDQDRLTPAHVQLFAALALTVAAAAFEPFSFAFVLPTVLTEYDGQPPIAWLPLCGVAGLGFGCVAFGYLGDRIGRRSSLLYGGALLVAASTLAPAREFVLIALMCFVTGVGVGSVLPVAYRLLVELVPVRRRAPILMSTVGVGASGGLLITTACASWLVPTLGWRVMWVLSLPIGLVFALVSRSLPDSPHYLFARGRYADAQQVARRFDILIDHSVATPATTPPVKIGLGTLIRPPVRALTLTLAGCAVAAGFVGCGFLLWLPAMLADADVDVTSVLVKASLFSIPGSVLPAWLYTRCGAKRTAVGSAATAAASLTVFAAAGDSVAHRAGLLIVLIGVVVVSLFSLVCVLCPYPAEAYSPLLRTGASRAVAAALALGGIAALSLSLFRDGVPELASAAFVSAIPMLLATGAIGMFAGDIARPARRDVITIEPDTRVTEVVPS